jgi:hypothetical protein
MKSKNQLFTLLLITVLGSISYTNAQTLQHKYTGNALSLNYYQFDESSYGYAMFNQSTSQILVFNSNHQLIKSTTIPIVLPNFGIFAVSKSILDNDGKFKYLVGHDNSIRIYNEDGIQLFRRDTANVVRLRKTLNGPTMELISTSSGWVEIYTLEGLMLKTTNANALENDIVAYPNPAKNNISFEIKNPNQIGNSYVVYNNKGELIHEGIIQENVTEVNTAMWAKGLYHIVMTDAETTSLTNRSFVIE